LFFFLSLSPAPSIPTGNAELQLLTLINNLGVREFISVQNGLTCSNVLLLGLLMATAGASLAAASGREIAADNLRPTSSFSRPLGHDTNIFSNG
jgi:hypothetical protein